MIKNKKVLVVIPARSGSKGLPGKNIKRICGRPLLQWVILTALKSRWVDKVIFSSDSKKYGRIAAQAGAEVPFIRPKTLASDAACDLEVLKHAVNWIKKNTDFNPDIIVRLQPTNPTFPFQLLDLGIEKLANSKSYDSIRPISPSAKHPLKMWKIRKNEKLIEPFVPEKTYGIKGAGNIGRQQLPKAFTQVGAMDVLWQKTLFKKNSMTGHRIGYIMVENPFHAFNIDSLLDFEVTEYFMKRKKIMNLK